MDKRNDNEILIEKDDIELSTTQKATNLDDIYEIDENDAIDSVDTVDTYDSHATTTSIDEIDEASIDLDQKVDFAEMVIEDGSQDVTPYELEEDDIEGSELIASIDIGSSKICCVIGWVLADGKYDVLGVGAVASKGMRRGEIVNIKVTGTAIKESLDKAMDNTNLHEDDLKEMVYIVGIGGGHVKGFNSPGIQPIGDRKIKEYDLFAVQESAKTVKISDTQSIIHVLPQEYMVDDNVGIANPIGMKGVRLATNVHIVAADLVAMHNLSACCEHAGIKKVEIALESIASAEAILTEEEKEKGVALVDIGGSNTDIVVYKAGTVRHTKNIPLGGHNLTLDLSVGLRTSLPEAEMLKEGYGCALKDMVKSKRVVEWFSEAKGENRKIEQVLLVEILEARMIEILNLIHDDLVKSGRKNIIDGGIVFTGGGSLLPHLSELAEYIFGAPVRIGYPKNMRAGGDLVGTPRCATAVGLVPQAWMGIQSGQKRNVNIFQRVLNFFSNKLS
ncbi:MAG: cell division protein FtsA [Desulfotalea sp.]